jgi:SAM-dependent methyltransferase
MTAASRPEAPGVEHRPGGVEQDSAWDQVSARFTGPSIEAERILEIVPLSPPARVLDLACGTGKLITELAWRGYRCAGIDQSEDRLGKARARAAAAGVDLHLVCGDIRSVVPGGPFDLVTCLYAMSCMQSDEDVLAVFEAVSRELAPEGRFVFNVLNREANVPESPVYASARAGHLRDFVLAEVQHLLARAGFRALALRPFPIGGTPGLDVQFTVQKTVACDG